MSSTVEDTSDKSVKSENKKRIQISPIFSTKTPDRNNIGLFISPIWIFGFLGIVWNALTVASLIKNGYDITIYGVPNDIYNQYRAFADLLYEHTIGYLFGIHLPAFLRDVLSLYLISNALLLRSIYFSAKRYLSGDIASPGEDGWENQEASRNILRLVNVWTMPSHILLGPLSHMLHMFIVRQIHRQKIAQYRDLHPREMAYRTRYAKRTIKDIFLRTLTVVWPIYVIQLAWVIFFAALFFFWSHLEGLDLSAKPFATG